MRVYDCSFEPTEWCNFVLNLCTYAHYFELNTEYLYLVAYLTLWQCGIRCIQYLINVPFWIQLLIYSYRAISVYEIHNRYESTFIIYLPFDLPCSKAKNYELNLSNTLGDKNTLKWILNKKNIPLLLTIIEVVPSKVLNRKLSFAPRRKCMYTLKEPIMRHN